MAHAVIEVRFEWDGSDPEVEQVATELAEEGITFPEALKDIVVELLSQESYDQIKQTVTLKEYT